MKIDKFKKHPLFFFFSLALVYAVLSMLEVWAHTQPVLYSYLNQVTVYVAVHAGWLYNLTGTPYKVMIIAGDGADLFVNGHHSVHVGFPCNGLAIWLIFIAFILAVGGKKKHMLWFIPLGCLSIHIINVIRVYALSLIANYNHNWLEFNHKYVFTLIVYSWVMLLFMFWIKKFSVIRTPAANETK